MENVLPPCEGYAPLEKAWRCIFPFSEECKGNIQREVLVAPEVSLGHPRLPLTRQVTELRIKAQRLGQC
jgi:hypothetical protein